MTYVERAWTSVNSVESESGDGTKANVVQLGQCVIAGDGGGRADVHEPATHGIVIAFGAHGSLILWNVYDDDGKVSSAPQDTVKAVDVGGDTCLSCPYWSGGCLL